MWSGGLVELHNVPTESLNVVWEQVGGMSGSNGNTGIEQNPQHTVEAVNGAFKHSFRFSNVAANYASSAPFIATLNGTRYETLLQYVGNTNNGEYVYRGEL